MSTSTMDQKQALSAILKVRETLRQIPQHHEGQKPLSDFLLILRHNIELANSEFAEQCEDAQAIGRINVIASVCLWALEEHGGILVKPRIIQGVN